MTYRLFLSSPGDVEPEREAVERVIERINAELEPGERFELIRWEKDYYTADQTFQDQIVKSSDCDIVICVFWKRLGSPLPDQYRRPDGTTPTGTEFEFELALNHATESPDREPDVLVYRKRKDVLFSETNLAVEKEQRENFLTFWNRWFRNEQGHFVAGFHSFDETADFEPLVERHIRKWLSERRGEVVWTKGSPFRGLLPFDVEHADIFFGRRRETDRARARFLANALAGARFMMITGASGSGKSSLVRAGLLPRLIHSGGLGDLPMLDRYAITSPGGMVLAGDGQWALGLANALFTETALGDVLEDSDFSEPAALGALIAQGGKTALAPVEKALQRVAVEEGRSHLAQGLILVIDQFEEVFEWPADAAGAFCDFLETVTQSAPVHVIATMRAEFQHRLGEVPALDRLVGLSAVRGPDDPVPTLYIGAPSRADLRDMIVGPARAAGLSYDGATAALPDLAERIEADASADALPALQFLLSELYERREGNLMTHNSYDALGGVTGVMAHRGDSVLAKAPAEDRAAFADLVRALVRTDTAEVTAVARRVPHGVFGAKTAAGRLAKRLQDAGLLTADAQGMRLSHESLISGWESLGRVVRDERHLFEIRSRLVPLCRQYLEVRQESSGKAKAALLRGLTLVEGQELLAAWGPDILRDPVPELPDYIQASTAAERRRKSLRFSAFAGLAAAIVAVAFVVTVMSARQREAQLEAELQSQLSAASLAAMNDNDWGKALAASARALGISQTVETRSLVLQAALEYASPQLLAQYDGPVAALDADENGKIVTLSRDGLMTFADGQTVQLDPPEGTFVGFRDLRLLPAHALVIDTSGGVALYDRAGLRAGRAEPRWLQGPGNYTLSRANHTAIWTDGDRFIVAIVDGSTNGALMDCDKTGDCVRQELRDSTTLVAVSPDGTRIATAQSGLLADEIFVQSVADPDTDELLGQTSRNARSLIWPNNDAVLAGAEAGFDVFEGTTDRFHLPPTRLEGSAVQARSPDGSAVVAACGKLNLDLCLIDMSNGLEVVSPQVFYGPTIPVLRLSWLDNERFASLHADQSWAIWTRKPSDPILDQIALLAAGKLELRAVDVGVDGTVAAGGQYTGVVTNRTAPPYDMSHAGWATEAFGGVTNIAVADDGTIGAIGNNWVDVSPFDFENFNPEPLGVTPERLAWIDDDQTLAITSARGIFLWPRGGEVAAAELPAEAGRTFGGVVALPDPWRFGYSLSNGALIGVRDDGTVAPLVPPEQSADRLSALSLDLHPNGRWLAASRSDNEVRLFDLTGERGPISLPLRANDSKVVAFSPDGARIAVLGSDGQLYVFDFDATAGRADPYLSLNPVPQKYRDPERNDRQANWIAWDGSDRIVIATAGGDLLWLSVDWQVIADYVAMRVRGLPGQAAEVVPPK